MSRGDKIYLDEHQQEASGVNRYLDCRDAVIEVYEYNDESGYGSKVRLFYCRDTKHESVAIIRQTWHAKAKEWIEEDMCFDSDSFEYLEALLNNNPNKLGGSFTTVRDYSQEQKP